MKRSDLSDQYCSIARASAQFVDGWTFVILREIYLGNKRFSAIRRQTGMSPRSLTLRLRKLEDEGILERVTLENGARSKDYLLTAKGHGLWPVLITLKQWGDQWCGPWAEDEPLTVEHKGKGHRITPMLICATCGEPVSAHSGIAVMSACFAAEREQALSEQG